MQKYKTYLKYDYMVFENIYIFAMKQNDTYMCKIYHQIDSKNNISYEKKIFQNKTFLGTGLGKRV